jgi:GMP synthase-like glutamine amidotransferase
MSDTVKSDIKKKVMVIQQVAHEGLGLIGEELIRKGVTVDTIRVYADESIPETICDYAALIVMGGPMGVYDEEEYPFIADEIRLIEEAFEADVPVLGICLGAQLMARARGAKVYKGKTKEIGWSRVRLTAEAQDDPITIYLPDEFKVFQWHGDTFDLPKGAVLLATSDEVPNQLVRIGPGSYAMQFHLEVTDPMIRQWLELPENIEYIKSAREEDGFGSDVESILAETPGNLPALQELSNIVFFRFFREVID